MSPEEWIKLLLITLLIRAVNACLKTHFEFMPNKQHPGTILETIPGVTMAACRRVCRKTKECYHFNMFWQGPLSSSCTLLSIADLGNVQVLVADTTARYFWSCPGEMTFEPSMNQCYQVITEAMNQTEALDYCDHMFPGVHLVDMESSNEHTLVNSLVEAAAPLALAYYTSGRNISPSPTAKEPTDFKWLSTDTNIIYSNWKPGQPNRAEERDKCPIPVKTWGWKWNDASCSVKIIFVCEF